MRINLPLRFIASNLLVNSTAIIDPKEYPTITKSFPSLSFGNMCCNNIKIFNQLCLLNKNNPPPTQHELLIRLHTLVRLLIVSDIMFVASMLLVL